MKKNTETLIDDNGIEVQVSYLYEKSPSQIEECHGRHEVGNMVYTELIAVEVVIAGTSINILHMMDERQIQKIIKNLSI